MMKNEISIVYNKDLKYSELCKMFGEEPKRGGSLQNQLSDWGRSYEIEKVKRGVYRILKKYTDVEKIEHQSYFKSKTYITSILCTLLNAQNGNVINVNMIELMYVLKAINDNFKYARWSHDNTMDFLLEQGETDYGYLINFTNNVESILRRLIKDALNSMKDKKLIELTYIPMFAREYYIDGKKRNSIRPMDKNSEEPHLLEAQRLAYKELKYDSWSKCVEDATYLEWQRINDIMLQHLKEKLGIAYFYYNYEIVLNKDGLQDEITTHFGMMQRSFNLYIQDKILNSKAKELTTIPNKQKEKYVQVLIDSETGINLKEIYSNK